MAFYYGNTIHLLFSLRFFRKHRKSSSTLNVQLKSVAKILLSVILFFLPFKKWYFQIQIRKLNPKMSTLTWTNLKVCSYDTQSYARECVTWSIEDISRIGEVCYSDALISSFYNKSLNCAEQNGWRSFRSAFASIWRMCSRVVFNSSPTSSSVRILPSSNPNRNLITFSSLGVNVLSTSLMASCNDFWVISAPPRPADSEIVPGR